MYIVKLMISHCIFDVYFISFGVLIWKGAFRSSKTSMNKFKIRPKFHLKNTAVKENNPLLTLWFSAVWAQELHVLVPAGRQRDEGSSPHRPRGGRRGPRCQDHPGARAQAALLQYVPALSLPPLEPMNTRIPRIPFFKTKINGLAPRILDCCHMTMVVMWLSEIFIRPDEVVAKITKVSPKWPGIGFY